MMAGKIAKYTMLMAETRKQAIQRVMGEAEKQGANAIVGMRLLPQR